MESIHWLSDASSSNLEALGGKGANLVRLNAAGFPVPPGFCIQTGAYRAFLSANCLEDKILALAAPGRAGSPAELEAASAEIRALFAAGSLPDEIAQMIRQAYRRLCASSAAGENLPVAVRSSATAEDLPDLSFAGQQDTYLNVVGEAALLAAVVRCWSSLWTARAIGYRNRNHIPANDVALAVVVQALVASAASGVMFTANPLTGKRGEVVIDATLGLGEALVSGQVNPDHYVVDSHSGRILSKTLGSKALSIRPVVSGGTQQQAEDAAAIPALSDAQILALAALGTRVEQSFGFPQDIEWALEGERIALVQSRPVTSLYPLPERVRPGGPVMILYSFGAVQGMLDPMTPLGRDIFYAIACGILAGFGQHYTIETQPTFYTAGERIYINFNGLLCTPFGRRIYQFVLSALDPVMAGTFRAFVDDPRFPLDASPWRLRTRLALAKTLFGFGRSMLANVLFPGYGRRRLARKIDQMEAQVAREISGAHSLADLTGRIERSVYGFPPQLLEVLVPAVAAGQAMLQPLLRLVSSLPGGSQLGLELTRGVPYNVTTEMDLQLWSVAKAIRADEAARAHFEVCEAAQLAREYLAGSLPATAQTALANFMQRYGMRGLAEIDMGRPRWREDPSPLMQALKSYLQMTDEAASPQAAFERGAARAAEARDQLVAALRRTKRGFFKARYARFAAGRMRELVGLRETPKFTAIRMMGIWRQALLEQGARLASEGALDRADDLFFFTLNELKLLEGDGSRDWRALAQQRREAYDREKRRKQIPRLILTDGTTIYDQASAAEGSAGILAGSPVSPGVAEGNVRVVLDPRGAQLEPGDILVCPATDPSWTPLFLAAGGLVMEVGGMMTHGSVVAREYGIPAVVGVTQATSRLKTGQRVRLDGSSGQVILIDDHSSSGKTNLKA